MNTRTEWQRYKHIIEVAIETVIYLTGCDRLHAEELVMEVYFDFY